MNRWNALRLPNAADGLGTPTRSPGEAHVVRDLRLERIAPAL
jgi:hypothetical protein